MDKTWKVLLPGDTYPLEVKAKDKRGARAAAMAILRGWGRKIKRLPRGAEVWEFTPKAQQQVRESMRRDAEIAHRSGQMPDI